MNTIIDYITKDDMIVFSSTYNEVPSINLLSVYKKIIFSDYALDNYLFDEYFNQDFISEINIPRKYN